MAISIADPGGPIEAVKETSATLKTVLAAAERGEHGGLVSEIARETADDARQHKNPLAGFKPTKGATAGVEILDELRAVNGIVSEKASPRTPRPSARGCSTPPRRRRTPRRRAASWASTPSA